MENQENMIEFISGQKEAARIRLQNYHKQRTQNNLNITE